MSNNRSNFTGYNTITNNWYSSISQKKLDKPADIYSSFSKKTQLTYNSIHSKTKTRISENNLSRKEEVISTLSKNQFIPSETLETFMLKKNGERPSKKIYFAKQPGASEKRELLDEYLRAVKDRELERLKNK